MVTSKKFCAISGITLETLRHYIDLELLKPAKVLANGYREFSIDNAVEVFYLRHERGLGASLNQFHPENEAESLADQDARYQDNLVQLQKQKALLERTDRTQSLLPQFNSALQSIRRNNFCI